MSFTLPPALAPLRHRNYRLLWFGTMISSSGDWMDQIAFNWLVYDLTGSAVSLGIVNFARMIPVLLFTLLGGVVADRMERRRLLFVTQTGAMLLAFLLAGLVASHLVQFWMVVLIAMGRGTMLSFNAPARQSLISDLTPPADLMSAVALNSATLNLTRVLGPSIGGALLATVGTAGAFGLNAASFLAVLWGLSQMRFGERVVKPKTSVLADLTGGLRYIQSEPNLRTLVMLALVPMIFGMPYQAMLTVFAKDILHAGGGGLGLLSAATGVGAVAGSLTVASQRGTARHAQLMVFGLVGFGISLMLFAASSWLWLSLPLLMLVGVCQQIYTASNNTLIQVSVAPEFRGRVLSTMFLNRAAVPLGTVMAGFGAGVIGAPLTIGSMAAVLVALALLTRSIRVQAVAALPQHGARGPAPHPSPLPNSGGRAQDERGQASGIMDTPVLGLSPLAPSIGGKGPGDRGPVPAPHSTRSQS